MEINTRAIVEHYCGRAVRNKVASPFTRERTPSLHIYDNTNRFKDFSSGHGGDGIEFVKLLFNCGYKEALKIIERDMGVRLGNNSLNVSEWKREQRAKEREEALMSQMQSDITSMLHTMEAIYNKSLPYSVKNLGCYRYREEADVCIWAVKQVARLERLWDVAHGYEGEYEQAELFKAWKADKFIILG